MQLRDPGDPRLLSPNRDYGHTMPFVMQEASALLSEERWPELQKYLADRGVSPTDVGRAFVAMIHYVTEAGKRPDNEDMETTLGKLGWNEIPEPAQVAMCAAVGVVVLGCFHTHARDLLLGHFVGLHREQDFVRAGEEFYKRITRPAWQKRLSRAWQLVLKGLTVWRYLRRKT